MHETRRSIPSLDGLRALAVAMVLIAHANLNYAAQDYFGRHRLHPISGLINFDFGDLGVSLFFVISGFLITSLLLQEVHKTATINLSRFYLRRFFRIFPPYYVYLAIIFTLWFAHRVPLSIGGFIASAGYYSNYYPYSFSHPESTGWLIGHTWSLSLEEQFYLFWPFALQRLGNRRALNLGIALLVLAPFSRLLTLHYFPSLLLDSQITRMFHTRIDTIMAGSILALAANMPQCKGRLTAIGQSPVIFVVTSALLLGDVLLNALHPYFLLSVGLSFEAVLLAIFLWCAVQQSESVFGRILSLRVLRHFGVISYSLYLWQQLFLGPRFLMRRHVLLSLVFVLICAELSYWLVEKSSFTLRDRFMKA